MPEMMNQPPMGSPAPPAPPAPMEESEDSCSVPTSALKGAKVGDTVSFKVSSIDGDTAMLSYGDAVDKSNMNTKDSTVSQAAKLFDEGGDE